MLEIQAVKPPGEWYSIPLYFAVEGALFLLGWVRNYFIWIRERALEPTEPYIVINTFSSWAPDRKGIIARGQSINRMLFTIRYWRYSSSRFLCFWFYYWFHLLPFPRHFNTSVP